MSSFERPDTPAQTYAAATGGFLLGLGVLALIFASLSFETVGVAADEILLWSVTGWTAVFWIALGTLGVLSVFRLASARMFAIGAGLLFGAVALWGFADGESVAGLLAATLANNVTYAVLAALGLLFGTLPRDTQRAPGDVERERRFDREMTTGRVPTGRP